MLISALHIGLTKEKNLRRMFKDSLESKPDIIVNAGDYCGGTKGSKSVRTISRLTREFYPDIPVLSVIGNHDYWTEGRKKEGVRYPKPGLLQFTNNYQEIIQHFQDNNIHFLDTDGPFEMGDLLFVGNSGWYSYQNPPTNDSTYLPLGLEGDTHNYMRKRSRELLFESIESLDKLYDESHTVLYVSHFPVVFDKKDRNNVLYGGDHNIGTMMKENYNCEFFLEGHSHIHKNSVVYNCGSDYKDPKFLIIEV